MLQQINLKPEVVIRNSRWRLPPFWKHINDCNSAKYQPILIKFGVQAQNTNIRWEITKLALATIIQNGHSRHLEIYIKRCHFIANCLILAKFCKQMHLMMAQKLNLKTGTVTQTPRWQPPPCWKHFKGLYSVNCWSILTKFQTQHGIRFWPRSAATFVKKID